MVSAKNLGRSTVRSNAGRQRTVYTVWARRCSRLFGGQNFIHSVAPMTSHANNAAGRLLNILKSAQQENGELRTGIALQRVLALPAKNAGDKFSHRDIAALFEQLLPVWELI